MTAGTAQAVTATGSSSTILVVDEDATVVDLLGAALRFQGFDVQTAVTAAEAVELARRVPPTAVICEVALPGGDGFTLPNRLRAHRITAPVLFLTRRSAMVDKLTGLRGGGEDYITKPFSLEEVVVRLGVVLGRTAGNRVDTGGRVLTFADLELDERSHLVCKAGKPATLSPTEFTLLRLFMDYPGVVLSRAAIAEHLWPRGRTPEVTLVETHVSHLRRKIDTGDTALLHTVRGRGYVLRHSRADDETTVMAESRTPLAHGWP